MTGFAGLEDDIIRDLEAPKRKLSSVQELSETLRCLELTDREALELIFVVCQRARR
jgi:hypothetical protein